MIDDQNINFNPSVPTLKQVREFLGMTQEEFGQALGITRNTIGRHERGVHKHIKFSVAQIKRLQNLLDGAGISISDLPDDTYQNSTTLQSGITDQNNQVTRIKSRDRTGLTRRSNSSLETLRIERTNFSQDELAIYCEIPSATYRRWISGKTEARPTIRQLKLLCQYLGIERIDELPDDFGAVKEILDDG